MDGWMNEFMRECMENGFRALCWGWEGRFEKIVCHSFGLGVAGCSGFLCLCSGVALYEDSSLESHLPKP